MSTIVPPVPCAELHLHLEGTLEPELIFTLADRNRIELPYRDIDDLRSRYGFSDLQSFLDILYTNMGVLRRRDDFAELTSAYLTRAATGGVLRAEMMIDPQPHLERGVAIEDLFGGIADATQDSRISTGLIVNFHRDRPPADAVALLTRLLTLDLDLPVLAIGLDSSEVGYPPELFVEAYALAKAHGLHRVAHAGEEGPPDYITRSLDLLDVERIDHGIRCLEDPALTERLARDRIPLTVCPLSNVRLRAVDTLQDHPILRMLDRQLLVSVNSDDPAYFGGYVDTNFAALTRTLHLSAEQTALLAENSVDSAFIGEQERDSLRNDIATWLVARQGMSETQ